MQSPGEKNVYYKDDDDDENSTNRMQRNGYFDDDEDESRQRLVSPGDIENGTQHHRQEDDGDEDIASLASLERGKRSGNEKWICAVLIAILLIGGIMWGMSFASMGKDAIEGSDEETNNHVDFDDLYNSSFVPLRRNLVWVENDPRDGVFSYSDRSTGDILLESVQDGTSEVLVKATDLAIDGDLLAVSSFQISPDGQFLMLWTNVTKQWRHSTRSNIYIFNMGDKSLFPLTDLATVKDLPQIAYAKWSPSGHRVAYVMNNDLYVTDLVASTRITYDGSATVFNGVPDWVYEEEVFGTDSTLWWSPDSTHLAYLRFNETAVPEYHVPFYTVSNSSYPVDLSIKYPKAGSPNPLVSLHIYSLTDNASIMVTANASTEGTVQTLGGHQDFADDDRLITDVTWATNDHSHLLFKQMNRVQDHEITSLVTIGAPLDRTTVGVARRYHPNDGGWIEVGQSLVYVPSSDDNSDKSVIRYIDLADNDSGYLHLAIFSASLDGRTKVEPVWLTSGEWEVVAGSVVMDTKRGLIHFFSTERSPLERHLYTVSLKDADPASTKLCLTCPEDPETHAYYTASFSPKAGYYVLGYEGPDIPMTMVKSVDNSSFSSVLEDNTALKTLLEGYELPRSRMVTIESGGVAMNAVEILPPDFKADQKYPVLFNVYGGPGSQTVSYRFSLDWHVFLASKLQYIVVMVDGRGTGYRGRAYRMCVRKRLGELEVIDQVNAGRHWASLDYVDPYRMAIWGWSYGGYMASKVVEANDGVFSIGMAVAPVTDWRFYDSIYTERYMLTPQQNPDGYAASAVSNMTGFANAKYLIAHGTGDDNVHFQNAAVLVDKLTQASVHSYRAQFYPDSNHRINYHEANPNIYYLLTEFLWESFGGKDYMHVRSELHGRFSGPIPEH
ncbi:dipeptidyl peptidase IV N-terminal region-domain-containing protein [Dichotomocladium elegans]|nr:dipeptidyl peptidase IV N-terminal region-domain-containing protein [Dichotomocladium elegans]